MTEKALNVTKRFLRWRLVMQICPYLRCKSTQSKKVSDRKLFTDIGSKGQKTNSRYTTPLNVPTRKNIFLTTDFKFLYEFLIKKDEYLFLRK